MKILIISHSADWDGLMSAAILYNKLATPDNEVILKLYNYNEDETFLLDIMDFADEIYISDVSLSDDTMKKYESKIIYIDHHAKTINHLLEFCNFKGGMHNIDGTKSAARLCYEYFHHKDCKVPQSIFLISEYDISGGVNKPEYVSLFKLGLDSLPFTTTTCYKLLNNLITSDNIILKGITINDFIISTLNANVLKNSWDIKINNYKGKAILTDWPVTLHIKDLLNDSDIDFVLSINILNNIDTNHYRVSIRVNPNSDFNAAEFASHFIYNGRPGGGHNKAAGCIITENEFLQLRNNKTLNF